MLPNISGKLPIKTPTVNQLKLATIITKKP